MGRAARGGQDGAGARALRLDVLEAVRRIGGYPELYEVDGAQVSASPLANRVQAWTVGASWALSHRWDAGGPGT